MPRRRLNFQRIRHGVSVALICGGRSRRPAVRKGRQAGTEQVLNVRLLQEPWLLSRHCWLRSFDAGHAAPMCFDGLR
jgi:hypothetical protein